MFNKKYHSMTTAGVTACFVLATQALITANAQAGSPSVPSEKNPAPLEEKNDKFFQYFSTNISYLYGFNWDTPYAPSHDRDIITVEHYDVNKFGDLYFFVDFMNLSTSGRGNPESDLDIYGELSPRLSFSKIFGVPCKWGIIKDFYFYSGTLELGNTGSLDNVNKAYGSHIDTSQSRQLHGVAVDLDLPYFAYAQLNVYWRDDLDVNGSTWQVTGVWGIPFKIGPANFMFKGFFDWCGREGELHSTFHTSPQLVVDAGELLFKKKDTFLIGTEVDIWVNEFGTEDQDDYVPQLMAQFYF